MVGPWGSGKTSILNLMEEGLAEDGESIVIRFNPWMFSGTEQLVDAFFHELGAQLRETGGKKFDKIATAVDQYSFLFSPLTLIPVAGGYIGRALDFAKGLKKYSDSKKPSVNAQREQLRNLLSELDFPIIVTVDDIDRLSNEEIRAIFKLVRLTGNFPNLVYVVAFDRERVEGALTAGGFDGKAYVEKIVQQGIRVPELSTQQLASLLTQALNEALDDIGELPYVDQDRWLDILAEVILPMTRTMRDVRRFTAAAASAARDFGTQFDLADILALEAIQVFLPAKFALITESRDALTSATELAASSSADTVLRLTDGGGNDNISAAMTALINRVFPFASRHIGGPQYGGMFGGQWQSEWLTTRRLAHRDLLDGYLDYTSPEILLHLANAERALNLAEDTDGLTNFLRSLDLDERASAIDAFKHYESRFTVPAVAPTSIALLNLAADFPRVQRTGFFSLETTDIIRIQVRRLLRKIKGRDDAYDIVNQIMSNVAALSSKFELAKLAGNRDDFNGEGIIDTEQASDLEDKVSLALMKCSSEELAAEWNLLIMLSTLNLWGYDQPPAIFNFANAAPHRALLRQAQSTVVSQVVGNRAVYRATRLHWDALKRVYGTDDAIRQAVEAVEATLNGPDDELAALVVLAKRYLAGELPDDEL